MKASWVKVMAIALVICAQNSTTAPIRVIPRVFIPSKCVYSHARFSLEGISGVCSQTHISTGDAMSNFLANNGNMKNAGAIAGNFHTFCVNITHCYGKI
jgi:hypothetical protein